MNCSTFDCHMPAHALVYQGLRPSTTAVRYTPCESHLPGTVKSMVAAGTPFTIVPWQVVDSHPVAV